MKVLKDPEGGIPDGVLSSAVQTRELEVVHHVPGGSEVVALLSGGPGTDAEVLTLEVDRLANLEEKHIVRWYQHESTAEPPCMLSIFASFFVSVPLLFIIV